MGRVTAKRLLDLVVSSVLLLLAVPIVLLLLIGFAIDMLVSPRDRGGLLYRERRVSKGRTFDLLKFRTLRCDVLERTGGHARPHEANPENLTWVGRHLLKPCYLDELPQLLNVLRGDISMVGPRPWPPELVAAQVQEGLTYRNEIPAGLTGPAQVTKGTASRYADLDLSYLERCSTLGGAALVRYDVGILWRTLRVIARREGLSY